jgi:peptidoglycan DL-endopeptidase CwlO
MTQNFAKKLQAITACAVVFVASTGTALADQFDDQIKSLESQAATQQAQAQTLHAQADTLANKLAGLQAQAAALQDQINVNQAKYNQVTDAINANKLKLESQKKVLGASIKSMYLDQTVTPLEMLASANSFSDFLDEQQSEDKIKQKIQAAMSAIESLQNQLQTQQTQLTQILGDQKGQEEQLAELQNQTNALLASTRGQEAAYEQQVATSNSQIATLRAQQAAAIARASRHIPGGTSAGCAGYPSAWCNAPQDSIIDSWGMYNRECVSYAAWAASVRFGHYVPYWGGRGNANQWPGNASAAGIPVDHNPHVGDVAIYMGGPYGHAMIVEQVGNGVVDVSSYNADNTGHYSYDEWSTSALVFIHFR